MSFKIKIKTGIETPEYIILLIATSLINTAKPNFIVPLIVAITTIIFIGIPKTINELKTFIMIILSSGAIVSIASITQILNGLTMEITFFVLTILESTIFLVYLLLYFSLKIKS